MVSGLIRIAWFGAGRVTTSFFQLGLASSRTSLCLSCGRRGSSTHTANVRRARLLTGRNSQCNDRTYPAREDTGPPGKQTQLACGPYKLSRCSAERSPSAVGIGSRRDIRERAFSASFSAARSTNSSTVHPTISAAIRTLRNTESLMRTLLPLRNMTTYPFMGPVCVRYNAGPFGMNTKGPHLNKAEPTPAPRVVLRVTRRRAWL